MMLRDGAAIQAGRQRRPVGYDCDIDWTPGVTDSGERYDAVQRNIKTNHWRRRRRSRWAYLRRDDITAKETTMTKTILVDGMEVRVEDIAVIVQRALNGLSDRELQEEFEKKKTTKKS
jgi:hypothetical protein